MTDKPCELCNGSGFYPEDGYYLIECPNGCKQEIDAIRMMMGVYAEQEDLREEEDYYNQMLYEESRLEDERQFAIQQRWKEYLEDEYRRQR